MVDSTEGAPAPKKRSLFKRAAWQDAPKSDNVDMFSHSNEFGDIVAEQNKRKEEEERARKAAAAQARRQPEQNDKKRRKVSIEAEDISKPDSPSRSRSKVEDAGSPRKPISPARTRSPSDSSTARYNVPTRSGCSQSKARGDPISINSDDDDVVLIGDSTPTNESRRHIVPEYSHNAVIIEDDDEVEEYDPTLAALAAKARQRAAQRIQSANSSGAGANSGPAPVAELFIEPRMDNAKPLMVKVRIDSTMEKPRSAWCQKQQFTPELTREIFFTWKGGRIYDSTTVKRLGIVIDKNGNVSIEGDSNIYDDENLPRIAVEAWTEDLFQQWKKEEAAEAAAKERAAASPVEVQKTPTPEPVEKVKRVRIVLKAKGQEDFNLKVFPDSTFAHIANAYKIHHQLDEAQPLTLFFDGDRLSPLDTLADTDIENEDAIEVHFK